MGVPLFVGDEVIGTLEVGSQIQDAFSEPELALLDLFSSHVAISVNNASENRSSR